MDIKRAELHIPTVGRNEAECENCPDRFSCWTDNSLILYADYHKVMRNERDGNVIFEAGFTIQDNLFIRGCIKADSLFKAVTGHNVTGKESLFYDDFKLLIISSSLTANFKDMSQKLVIEAKTMK